jgi:outer membrane protein assembly factor BamB
VDYDRARTGLNPSETVLTNVTVARLKKRWTFALGSTYAEGQPVLAAGVTVAGAGRIDLLFAGDDHGDFYALDAASGAIVWRKSLGSVAIAQCTDIPDGVFGVTGSATIDRAKDRVYVADGQGKLWAFTIESGANAPGWPSAGLSVVDDATHDHVYGGLALDPTGAHVYTASGSMCDFLPWHGAVRVVDTSAAIVSATFRPYVAPAYGGGVWSLNGVAQDPRGTGALYIATGNDQPDATDDADSVVRLDANANAVAQSMPDPGGFDLDFGTTPVVANDALCATPRLVAERKSGVLYVYDADAIANGPAQSFVIGSSTDDGVNVTNAAYDATRHLLFAGSGSDGPTNAHGLLAFSMQAGCTLAPAWQRSIGASGLPPSAPTIANGVVYFADGTTLYAFDESSGTQLWSTTAGGPIFDAPTVVNGRVYFVAWDGTVSSYGL